MKSLKSVLILVMFALVFSGISYAEKIIVEGSTTVLPIAQRAAEEFMDKNKDADISVKGGGSGVGITSLIDGGCAIATASRSMKEKGLDEAIRKGKDPKAFVVAMDGIAVIVNPGNKISALDKSQVKGIYTGKYSNWSQIGGVNEKIVVISRDSASGTFEAFGELAMDKEKVRPDALLAASIVSKTPGAIGYVGLGFMSGSVKSVTLNGISPSKDTVLNGTYPLARPLFMYTNGQPKNLAKEFIDYILSKEGQKIADEEGYVGLAK